MANLTLEKLLDRVICLKKDLGPSDMTSGHAYEISVYYKRCKVQRQINFVFNDNYKNASSKRDWLYALYLDAKAFEDALDVNEFSFMFGYGPVADKDTRKMYKACKKQSKLLHWLFNEVEIKLLSTIE